MLTTYSNSRVRLDIRTRRHFIAIRMLSQTLILIEINGVRILLRHLVLMEIIITVIWGNSVESKETQPIVKVFIQTKLALIVLAIVTILGIHIVERMFDRGQ